MIEHDAPAPMPAPGVTVQYGQYLATIGGCRSCHGQQLAGDANPDAPNITVWAARQPGPRRISSARYARGGGRTAA